MKSFIKYENCFFCGSPIREMLLLEVDTFEDIQLPYCSDNCYKLDSEALNVVEQTKSDNNKNKTGGEAELKLEKILNNPDVKSLIEAKKTFEEQKLKERVDKENGKDFYLIFWMIIGIIFLSLLAIGISTNNQYRQDNPGSYIVFKRFIIIIGVALIGALIREVRNK
jgi:hypothetical protein